ncbi:hypothetical protein ABPG72_022671 [Tetrahymena utriculariae]
MNQDTTEKSQDIDQKIEEKKRICKLFLKRKNRFCKFECLEGFDYCHHHAHENARFLEEDTTSKFQENKQNEQNAEQLKSSITAKTGRIPCPLDPNHNVDINKLEKHLKKCQSFKQKNNVVNNIWFSKGINNKSNLSQQQQLELLGEEQQQKLHDLDNKKFLQQLYNEQAPQLIQLIEKIEQNFPKAVKLYKQYAEVDEMTEDEIQSYLLDANDDADKEKIIKKLKTENQAFSDTQKDHRQVCKLVEVMKQQGIWNNQYIYIEFGAGKGLLSHGIAKSLQLGENSQLTCEVLMESMKENSVNCKANLQKKKKLSTDEAVEEAKEENKDVMDQEQNQQDDIQEEKLSYKPYHACHVLLELESRRNKMDRLHRDNPFYLRYRTNILDFNVNALHQILQEQKYPYINQDLRVVGVSKHMCGGATDLSINTLLNCLNPQKFEGMMIATCCHHRCSPDTYTNNEFLMNELGYTSQDLQILFYCSSWYVSGQIKEEIMKKIEQSEQIQSTEEQNQMQNENNKENNQEEPKKVIEQSQTSNKEWLSSEKKSLIGKMVKRTVDIGRILNLIKKGKKGRIVKYCDFILSPENFVIIAK